MEHKVLFVCMGNSCRSPMAEAIFVHEVNRRGITNWKADSASILRWNVGKLPEPRCIAVLDKHGINTEHLGRLIRPTDFVEFDFIFGMDNYNIEDLLELSPPEFKPKIYLLGELDPLKEMQIRDPYFDKDSAGFEKCYEQCLRCINGFLDGQVAKENGQKKS